MTRITWCAFIAALTGVCLPPLPAQAQLSRTFVSAAAGDAGRPGAGSLSVSVPGRGAGRRDAI